MVLMDQVYNEDWELMICWQPEDLDKSKSGREKEIKITVERKKNEKGCSGDYENRYIL